jgi:dihydroorotate dehydrogenase (NAD+) catalytic subunit
MELVAAGASSVALGTVLFADPGAPVRIRAELEAEASGRGLSDPLDAKGISVVNFAKSLQIAENGTA